MQKSFSLFYRNYTAPWPHAFLSYTCIQEHLLHMKQFKCHWVPVVSIVPANRGRSHWQGPKMCFTIIFNNVLLYINKVFNSAVRCTTHILCRTARQPQKCDQPHTHTLSLFLSLSQTSYGIPGTIWHVTEIHWNCTCKYTSPADKHCCENALLDFSNEKLRLDSQDVESQTALW